MKTDLKQGTWSFKARRSKHDIHLNCLGFSKTDEVKTDEKLRAQFEEVARGVPSNEERKWKSRGRVREVLSQWN